MRVLHLIPSISPLRGGPSQAVLAMTAALRRDGVDAEILTTNDDGPGIDTSMPLGEWFERGGVPVLAFPRWSPPLRPLREFAFAPGLTEWLRRHGSTYQLLHVHALFSYPSTAGMAVARQIRLPYMLRTIGQLNRWSLEQSPRRKRVLLELVERANLHGASALHFTSASEAAEALDAGPMLGLKQAIPHIVMPLGVEVSDAPFEHPQPRRPVHFLFLSRLHPKKCLPNLFQALALLKKRMPGSCWLLQIAGDGDAAYLMQLQALAMSLGIRDQVHWLGFVMGAAKQQLLQQSDWFVLPSASENFGIAAAEALAAGTPVILSPGVALAAEAAVAGAGWCCSSDPEALAAQLARCLEPPPLAMRQAARKLAASNYSWDSISRNLSTQYRTILAR